SGADIELPRLQALGQLFTALKPTLGGKTSQRISAHAFDIDSEELMKDANIMELSADAIVHKLRARHALGATNLEAALKSIGDQARAAQNPRTFVLVSDGIPTWGAREPAALLAALGDWPAQHTLHALVIGSRQDGRILKAITEKTCGRIVTLQLGA